MKNKKLLSVILAMTMLFLTAQGILGTAVSASNVVSADSDGVFWLEESDYDTYTNANEGVLSARIGTNGTVAANTTNLVSGGDAYWAWWGSATYTSTYKVNAPSAGTYKLWYRGSNPTNAYYDKSKLKVNGTDITSSLSKVTGTDFTVIVDPSGTRKNFACAFFVAEVTLVSGENTISYEVLEKSTNGSKYACLVDCFVIAPSTYEWASPTIASKPVDTAIHFDALTGVAKFEESDYYTYSNASEGVLSARIGTNGTAAANTTALVSGGDAYWAWWGSATYTSTYIVDAPSAGTYKLWYRGSTPTNAYYDKSKLKVNGTDITSSLSKVTGTDFTVIVDPSGTRKTFACAFFVAEVTLVSGENTISYEVLEKSTNGSKYACLVDCFVIAPSTYEWESPTKDNLPEEVVDTTIHFDALTGVAKFEEYQCDTYSNASEGVLSARIGTNGTAAANTTDLVSGGDAYWAWWGSATYTSTYKVNAPSAGTYKLWYRGSNPTNAYYDKSKLKVNGTDITSSLSKVTGTDFTVRVDPSGTQKNFACAFFVAEVTLVSGENTISYEVLEKSTNGSRYACLVDCFVIAPSTYNWAIPDVSTLPQLPQTINISPNTLSWIEVSDASNGNGLSLISNSNLSESDGATIKTSTAPTGLNPYYLEFTLNSSSAAQYDIFLRGSSTNEWNSVPTVNVNGTNYQITDMGYDEGWIATDYNLAWSKVENVTIPSGSNTLKWIITTSRTESTEYYISLFDAFVILPHGAPFAPVSKDIDLTKLDSELALALAGKNILAPRADIVLPSETLSGKSISWSTSDSDIFDTSGHITRGHYDNPVTVTAVLGTDEYTREFDVTVPRLIEFIFDGNMSVGDTSISASIYLGEEAADKNARVICALFDSDERLVKAVKSMPKSFNQLNNSLDINITLSSPVAEGDKFIAFIWDSSNRLIPLSPKLTLGNKFLLKPFTGDVSFHTDNMNAYLNDSYTNISAYADGKTNLDKPLPITFRWSWLGLSSSPSEYTLSVSESSNMANPQVFTVDTEYCDVYNLKINTNYYWTVSAEDGEGNTFISDVATLKTENKAPRNLAVNGIKNIRDLGGWNTLDGKQVKQGYLYRSFRLSYMDGETFKQQITSGGIATMRDVLGIQSEIDIRQESEMPLIYTESVLGADVNYFREPLDYSGDYLTSNANKQSIKDIFAELSDPDNYPIVYHCAAGADRTALVTYLVNGLLGVSQEDLFRDYLITNFAKTDNKFRPLSNITNSYVKTIDDYTGSTLSEKIYNYLSEVIEVPTSQLDFIIDFLKQ